MNDRGDQSTTLPDVLVPDADMPDSIQAFGQACPEILEGAVGTQSAVGMVGVQRISDVPAAEVPAHEAGMGVYAVRNLVDGAVYIGSATDVSARWWQHRAALERACHPNAAFQAAWLQLGGDRFELSVLENVSRREDLAQAEQRWIDRYRVDGVRRVYNAQSRAIRRRRTPLNLDQAARRLHLSSRQLVLWVREGRVLCRDGLTQTSSQSQAEHMGFDREEIDEVARQVCQPDRGRLAEIVLRLRSYPAKLCRRLRRAR